jgi:hypothetical protein
MDNDFTKAQLRKVEKLLHQAAEEMHQVRLELASVGKDATIQRAEKNLIAAIMDTEETIMELQRSS